MRNELPSSKATIKQQILFLLKCASLPTYLPINAELSVMTWSMLHPFLEVHALATRKLLADFGTG
jgi:hypothetical protein